jgi:hypothetical protein
MTEVPKKQKGITVRADEETINKFMGMTAMIGSNASEVLRLYIEQYVKENSAATIKKLQS